MARSIFGRAGTALVVPAEAEPSGLESGDEHGEAPESTSRMRSELAPARPTYVATIVSGPERGVVFEIGGTQAVLGQGPACTIGLTDPLVSTRHLTLDVEDDGLRLRDVGSTSGTIVNGLRVVEALLGGGEIVRLGSTYVRVERSAVASPDNAANDTTCGRVAEAVAERPIEASRVEPDESAEGACGDTIHGILDRELPFTQARAEVIAEFERRYVARLLAKHENCVTRAAAAAGLARRYFQILRGRQNWERPVRAR